MDTKTKIGPRRAVFWVRSLVGTVVVLTAGYCFSAGRFPGKKQGTDTEDNTKDRYFFARQDMVRSQMEARDIKNKEVLRVMSNVPRHLYLPEQYRSIAYSDRPLPIGFGQTISQPYIVALMTEMIEPETSKKILEIGTGSGYQAAILAELVEKTYTIEIIPELASQAKDALRRQGYQNIETRTGDGYYGWPEEAPFDGIIVTCAPDHIPPPLVSQLKDGGIMVIPVGRPGAYQTLWQIKRQGDKLEMNNITGVAFVPLVRR